MGLFDSIWVKCAKCDNRLEFQSKGGDPFLENFTPENAPDETMAEAGGIARCRCGQWMALKVEHTVRHEVFPIKPPADDEAINRGFKKDWDNLDWSKIKRERL